MTAPAAGVAPIRVERLSGVVLEVADLGAAKAFYDPIFREHNGAWRVGDGQIAYETGAETIELVEQASPRTFHDSGAASGHHQAYGVAAERIREITDRLAADGHEINWWREDHPDERSLNAYTRDPSGNQVQLLASTPGGRLLDHVAIEVYAFDYCEYLYVTVLGGAVDYYHGWRRVDLDEAKVWASGDDPCAPWTRRNNPSYRDFLIQDPTTGELRPPRFAGELGVERSGPQRVGRPQGQVFITFGPSRLGLVSATRIWQELPEEVIKATPRLVFAVAQSADLVEEQLGRTPIPFEREGERIYVRDADGNFAELRTRS